MGECYTESTTWNTITPLEPKVIVTLGTSDPMSECNAVGGKHKASTIHLELARGTIVWGKLANT